MKTARENPYYSGLQVRTIAPEMAQDLAMMGSQQQGKTLPWIVLDVLHFLRALFDIDWIFAREARGAELRFGKAGRAYHSLVREKAE